MKQTATACQHNLPGIQFLSSILLVCKKKKSIQQWKGTIFFFKVRGAAPICYQIESLKHDVIKETIQNKAKAQLPGFLTSHTLK